MVEDNFDLGSEDDLHINCDIVSVFPTRYDRVPKASEAEEDYVQDEAANQKHVYYYVMKNSVVEE